MVSEFEELEASELPTALLAVTVYVYATPSVNPERVIGEEVPVAVTAAPPPLGVAVTV